VREGEEKKGGKSKKESSPPLPVSPLHREGRTKVGAPPKFLRKGGLRWGSFPTPPPPSGRGRKKVGEGISLFFSLR